MYHVNPDLVTQFSPEQLTTLEALRSRYGEDGDRFTTPEREQLEFLRWLILTGRLDAENVPDRKGGDRRESSARQEDSDEAN